MNGRPPASAGEIRVGRFGWAAEVPWLPDLLAAPRTVTGNVVAEAFGRQIAFLRALAAGAPPNSAVQLRYTAGGSNERVACHLLAAADSQAAADLLSRVVAAALPPELPLAAVQPSQVNRVLRAVNVDKLTSHSVAEIRRSVDRLDPTLDGNVDADMVIFPWTWSAQALLTSLSLLPQQSTTTTLVIHAEPVKMDASVALFLQDEIGRLIGELREGEEQPLTRTAIHAYSRWLRLLPRAALHMRVLVAGDGDLAPGLAASVSTDLTATYEGTAFTAAGAADIVEPVGGAAIDACAALLDELRSYPISQPPHSEMAQLLHLFDPLEAHAAFRFPIAPRGGLPGVGTRRLAAVGSGLPARSETAVLPLGTTTIGTAFGLSRGDLNQHVLVAGLPGFGKSSTIRLLLQRAFLDHDLPFLVIDPAKGDYGQLIGAIADRHPEADVRIHHLRPDDVAFNPMAVPEGVAAAVHGGRVAAVFEGVMDFSDWPFGRVLLRRVMSRLYDEAANEQAPQPTLADLYRRCGELIGRLGVTADVSANITEGLLGRIELLSAGPAGRAFLGGTQDTVPWEEIISRPTLIELGAFAGPVERSLLFGLLMAGLISWREAHPTPGLSHLTVLEEAHRVLRASMDPDPGVELFVDAIAELRGAGEGFIVVDQSPTSLHPSVSKLAGTKIIHRLVEREDRQTAASAMVLDSAASEDVARLGRQRIIAYAASAEAAELVDVDDWRSRDDEDLVAEPPPPPAIRASLVDRAHATPVFCVGCPVMCKGRAGLPRVMTACQGIDRSASDAEMFERLWDATLTLTIAAEVKRSEDQRAQAYCAAAAGLAVLSEDRLWRLPRRLELLQDRVAVTPI